MADVFKSEAGRQALEAAYRELLTYWPVPAEPRRIETRFGETFVIVCGPEDGPALFLHHGSSANSASWMLEIEAYASDFRCYCVDMIGEPGLSAPVRRPLASEDHALWLDDVMQALGVEAAAFCGVSLGGWLVLDYAHRRPGRVRALAGIVPAGIGRQKNFLLKAFPLFFMGKTGAQKIRELILGPAPDEENTPAEVQRFGAFMNLVMDQARPRFMKIPRLTDEELARLSMPVLIIAAGRDALIDSADIRRRVDAHAPKIEVDYRPEAYHFIADAAGKVSDFLRRKTGTLV
ncbi:alpha/beta hydrolase [Thalassovita mediterranea]|nr:alpha/beta hydrolase [Thalassovita mediterranea]